MSRPGTPRKAHANVMVHGLNEQDEAFSRLVWLLAGPQVDQVAAALIPICGFGTATLGTCCGDREVASAGDRCWMQLR